MGYKQSDASMMMATQIAYLNFDGKKDHSAGEVVDKILSMYTSIDSAGNRVVDSNANSFEQKQAEVAINIEKLSNETNGVEGWQNWHVVDVCNDQQKTGYYGMLIDTGNGDAIIGCRGSESYDEQQVLNDWVVADVGLLDNKLTEQQSVAQKYMEQLYYKYGDKYDSFSLSGHSLGGNLAEHMAVTAPAEMRDKIDHAINFDGPGFSQEYIDSHKDAIAKSGDLIDHYQWSWVSSLLISLPGVKDHIIKAHDEEGKGYLMGMLYRHDTHNVEYNEDGNVMVGDESDISKILGPISRYLEHTGEGRIEDLINAYLMKSPVPGLRKVIGTLYAIKLLRVVCPKIEETLKAVGNKLADLYYDYIASNASSHYQVKPSKVLVSGAELQNEIKKLKAISEEIGTIRKDLKYWSTAGAYYRSRLLLIKGGIDANLYMLCKLYSQLGPIMEKYDHADMVVEEKFALLSNEA